MDVRWNDRAGKRVQAAARNCGGKVMLRMARSSLVLACARPVLAVFLSEDYIDPKRLGGFFGASPRRRGGFAERFSLG
jgi:hypothetical protein